MLKNTVLKEKIKESLSSVLPITIIVLIMSFTITPLPNYLFILFFVGAVFMIIGTGLFSMGADRSMSRMGEYIGTEMARSRKIWLITLLSVFVGFIVTVSEPDLQVLASYTPSIDTTLFIISVSAGVGIFLAVAVLRIVFNVKVKYILLISYGILFIIAAFAPKDFWAVAFDAGGVTTGVMSVPFIISIGAGISAISTKRAGGEDDNFGLMAICSVGPVIALLILGMLNKGDMSDFSSDILNSFENSKEMGLSFLYALPEYMLEVAEGLLPILVFFIIYQWISAPVGRRELLHVLVGALISYIGIVLFLTGVNLGFMPVASYVGELIGGSDNYMLMVPVGMIFGYFIVSAEPAVKVLVEQVQSATSGMIPPKALSRSLAIGVAIASGIAMLRAVTGVPIMWFVGGCYAAALIMMFFVPGVFTSIAFDAGGAASGPMTATFLLPFAVGACTARGGNVMQDAFGVIALVAAAPTFTIQILGLIYKIQMARAERTRKKLAVADTEIFEFDYAEEDN